MSTASGPLRKHLYSSHLEVWLAECERLNLTIRAKDAVEAIAASQGVNPGPSPREPRPQFTQERFVNALASFIVSSDQVGLNNFFNIILTVFLPSLLVLWRIRSFANFFFYFVKIFKIKTFPIVQH